MFPLGFLALALGLFIVDSAVRKRPIFKTLEDLVTNPSGYKADLESLTDTTFQQPSGNTTETASNTETAAFNVSAGVEPVVSYALAQVGKPYVWGGAGPNSFDCSGLSMRAYQQVGINLPHGSIAQSGMGTAVNSSSETSWEPGDLLFPYPDHVEIYVGNGMMVEAADPARGVVKASALPTYWRVRRYVNGSTSKANAVVSA